MFQLSSSQLMDSDNKVLLSFRQGSQTQKLLEEICFGPVSKQRLYRSVLGYQNLISSEEVEDQLSVLLSKINAKAGIKVVEIVSGEAKFTNKIKHI